MYFGRVTVTQAVYPRMAEIRACGRILNIDNYWGYYRVCGRMLNIDNYWEVIYSNIYNIIVYFHLSNGYAY